MAGGANVPWWALGLACGLLLIALGAAGFAIGAGSAPDGQDAAAARAQARAAAYRAARAAAARPEFKAAYAEALPDGSAAGRRRGSRNGRRAGEKDAADAAQRERDRIASQLSDCPDFTDEPVFDISVRGIDCGVGSGLIREYFACQSTSCTLSNGWPCTTRTTGELTSETRCSDGLRAVRFSIGD